MTIEINNVEQQMLDLKNEKNKGSIFLYALAAITIFGVFCCIFALSSSAKDDPIVQKVKYNAEVRNLIGRDIERRAFISQFCSKSDLNCSPLQSQRQFLINGTKGTAKVEYIVDKENDELLYLNVKGIWGTNGNVLIVSR